MPKPKTSKTSKKPQALKPEEPWWALDLSREQLIARIVMREDERSRLLERISENRTTAHNLSSQNTQLREQLQSAFI